MSLRLCIPLVLMLTACNKHVVRDAETYKSEMAWFSVSFEQSAEALEEAAAQALASGDREKCLEYAELALVVGIRGPHHTEKALSLAELGEDPGEEPEVPAAETLCPEPAIEPTVEEEVTHGQ